MNQGTSGRLVVVSGPSGVGKSTVLREALRRTGAAFSVSATTRQPRPGETDGRDYRFMDRAGFEAMVEAGEMLEWAPVHGELYGTPAAPVMEKLAAGRTVVLDVDVQGGIQVHARCPEATLVLIVPTSLEELRRRLEGRGTETRERLEQRLARAEQELATARESGAYSREVVNDDLQRAVDALTEIVHSKE